MSRFVSPVLLVSLVVCSATGAAPIFRNPLPVPHGAQSISDLLSADFNGDGHEDALIVSPSESLSVLIANGTGPFAAPKITPITAYTGQPGIGDVNGDGRVDVVISDDTTRQAIPMLGNGDGTFTSGTSFIPNVPNPGPVAVGDFNGDGFADVAVGTIFNPGSFATHFGNGSGQFGTGTQTATSSTDGVRLLKAVDINGDGRSDLIAGDSSSNRVFVSNGDGTFVLRGGTEDGGVAIGDFNRDGKLDLAAAVGAYHSWFIEVALGNGNGSFRTPARYVAGYDATSIDAADIDDDGNLDLLAAGTQGSSVTVLRGKADGTFHTPEFFLSGPSAWKIVVADFDRDGAEDFLTLDYNNTLAALSFVRGKGEGTFHTYRSFHLNSAIPVSWPGLGTARPVTEDMNEDGRPDVVVIRKRPGTLSGPYELAVLLNDGSGRLAAPILSDTQSDDWDWNPTFELGDLNGDGWLDAVVISNPTYDAHAVSMLGNGDGTFDPPVEFPITRFGFPKLAHFNGDANLDLLIPEHDFATVYPGNGDGTFGAGIRSTLAARAMLYADLNGDGKMDFVSTWVRSVTVGMNDGTGRFSQTTVTSAEISGAALADFDGDGKIDLLCTSYTGTEMRYGNGDGTFGAPVYFMVTPVPNYPSAGPVETADFDGDGTIDVAFGTTIYLNDGNGGFRSRAQYRTYSGDLAVADLDGSGSPDLVYTNSSADDVAVLLTRTTADPTATASLTLTASKTVAGYGEGVKFDASVTGGDIPLSGVVVFSAGGRNLGMIAVNGEGKASFTAGFPIGAHTVTARYTGDEYYGEDSDSVGLTVTKATPTLSPIAQPNPSRSGQTVSIWPYLYAPRAYGFAGPSGNITVREGNTTIGTIPAGSENKVTIRTLSVGTHEITIEYPGDENYEAVSTSYTQTVDKPIPWVYVETTPASNALLADTPITLRARLSSTTATGTVTFYVDNAQLATVAIANGIAETQTTLSWGTHTLRMVYSGDATWDGTENSSTVLVKIGPWGTPLQIRASAAGSGSLHIRWSQVQDAASYKLWRRTSLAGYWTVWNTYSSAVLGVSISMPANTTEMFAVSAVNANGSESPLSTPDLATAVDFMDPTLVSRSTRIRAQHFLDLRKAIGAVRTFAGLPAFAYTNAIAPGQRIRKVDLTELRTALLEARNAIGLYIAFTDDPPSRVRAIHITELRAGVQ